MKLIPNFFEIIPAVRHRDRISDPYFLVENSTSMLTLQIFLNFGYTQSPKALITRKKKEESILK